MKRADIHRGFTEKAQCDSLLVQILLSKGHARSQRNLSAYDAVPAQKTQTGVKDVHRAAFPFRTARSFPKKFRHDRAGIHPLGQRVAVFAVRAEDCILRLEWGDGADGNGFLANVQVAKSSDFPKRVHLRGFLFKAPDQQHLLKKVLQELWVLLTGAVLLFDELSFRSARL